MTQEKGEPVKREKDIKEEEDDDDDLKDTIDVKLMEEDEVNSEWRTGQAGLNHLFFPTLRRLSRLWSIITCIRWCPPPLGK